MNALLIEQERAAIASALERDRAWLPHDHRGRWGVIESGAGRYLTDSSAAVRQIADAATSRRARRFSSLSRARRFARRFGGKVFRWRRTPPGGGVWQRLSPWDRARSTMALVLHLPLLLNNEGKVNP